MREIFRRGVFLLALIALLAGCSGPLAVSRPTPTLIPSPTPLDAYIQAERFLMAEISWALKELGLDPSGPAIQVVPHMYVLAISPRSEIRLLMGSSTLYEDLSYEKIESIETGIETTGEYSAWIREGFGTLTLSHSYVKLTDVKMMVRVAAHEWAHWYFKFTPFSTSPELSSLEEPVAIIGEEEISTLIYDKHRWGKVPGRPSPCRNEELRPVRAKVEELLSLGEIKEAEAYMEAERKRLCSDEWCPRKLSQAFFASCERYGEGAEGDNPTPGLVRELRARYPTLKEFLEEIREVSSYEDFLSLLEEKGVNYPEG